jgi:hypothetical protein
MRKAEIEEQNQHQIARQREFRTAADIIAKAWSKFDEVEERNSAFPCLSKGRDCGLA